MKTNEEIRADLLVKYGWEINANNELFPFVKLLYMKSENTNDKVEELKSLIHDTKKAVQKINTNQIHFDNSFEAFWYGFGKIGIALVTMVLSITLIFFLIFYKKEIKSSNEFKSIIEKTLTKEL
jgi:hypothetical protein